MAHFATTIESPLSGTEAFERLADVTRFAEWDPAVSEATQTAGDGPGEGAQYVLSVGGPRGDFDLRYQVTEFVEPKLIALEAVNKLLRSVDKITVETTDAGCVVTYSADLTMHGPMGLADAALDKAFQKMGDRAAGGLRIFLEAERPELPD